MSSPWELERLAPRLEGGERFVLDPAQAVYAVGRSEVCPVRLFSPSASRKHAEFRRDAEGRWWLHLAEGRSGLADGEPITGPCEVCEGLSIQLGADRLRCQRRRDDATQPGIAVPPAPGPRRSIVLGLLGLAILLIALGYGLMRGA